MVRQEKELTYSSSRVKPLGGGDGLHDLAGDVEPALQRVPGQASERDEGLGDVRHGARGQLSEELRVDRHVAPAEQDAAFRGHDTLARAPARRSASSLRRQEEHGHPVGVRRGQGEPETRRLAGEEPVRHLRHHARAIAGARIPAHRAAVHEVLQDGDAAGRRSGGCAGRPRSRRTPPRSSSARRTGRTALPAAFGFVGRQDWHSRRRYSGGFCAAVLRGFCAAVCVHRRSAVIAQCCQVRQPAA